MEQPGFIPTEDELVSWLGLDGSFSLVCFRFHGFAAASAAAVLVAAQLGMQQNLMCTFCHPTSRTLADSRLQGRGAGTSNYNYNR